MYYVAIPGQPDNVLHGPTGREKAERWAQSQAVTARMRMDVREMTTGAIASAFAAGGKRIEAP